MTAAEQIAEPSYTGPQVCYLGGATYRQLDFWCRSGYLHDTADGSGSRRRFTAAELDTVRTVVHLLAAGFTLEAAFGIAARLVAEDRYEARVADIFRLEITVVPTEEPA